MAMMAGPSAAGSNALHYLALSPVNSAVLAMKSIGLAKAALGEQVGRVAIKVFRLLPPVSPWWQKAARL